jgi:hypothetical protein
MKRLQRIGAALALAAGCILLSGGAASAALNPPAVAVDSTCLIVGTAPATYSLSVTGTNFEPTTDVRGTYDAGGAHPQYFSAISDAQGRVVIQVNPAGGGTIVGTHTIRLDDLRRNQAQATFTTSCAHVPGFPRAGQSTSTGEPAGTASLVVSSLVPTATALSLAALFAARRRSSPRP